MLHHSFIQPDGSRYHRAPISPHVLLSPRSSSLGAVEVAQVRVPADADNVDKQDAVLEGHEAKVDHLHKGPDHPVGGQGGHVALVELLPGRGALEDGHGGQEDADEGGREDALVEGDAGEDGGVAGAQVDVALEEGKPGRGGGAEDGCAV